LCDHFVNLWQSHPELEMFRIVHRAIDLRIGMLKSEDHPCPGPPKNFAPLAGASIQFLLDRDIRILVVAEFVIPTQNHSDVSLNPQKRAGPEGLAHKGKFS
jgi:hypothetical protein